MSSGPASAKPLAKSQTIKPLPGQQDPVPAQPVKIIGVAVEPAVKRELSIGRVSFELVRPGAKRVCVAGSFNDWRPDSAPLVPKDNGRWVADLTIQPGRYEYLFVVDGQWVPDPNAKESVQNPFGGRNSILGVSA